MTGVLGIDELHRREDGRHAAETVGDREQIRQMQGADHREVPDRRAVGHRNVEANDVPRRQLQRPGTPLAPGEPWEPLASPVLTFAVLAGLAGCTESSRLPVSAGRAGADAA